MAQATVAAVFISTATFAQDWNGLSFGASYSVGNLTTEVPFREFGLKTVGWNARFLTQGQSRWVTGVEANWYTADGEIKAGRRLRQEAAQYGFDVSGLIGVSMGKFLPHLVGGISYVKTQGDARHGSDGYHYGFGVIWNTPVDHLSLTVRHTYREFDGPAQGSDLRVPTTSIMVHWTF